MKTLTKKAARARRHTRIRMKVAGTPAIPRLAVFRSNKHIQVQLIDDVAGKTLAATSALALKAKGTKTEKSAVVGTDIAKRALALNIKKVVFDRGGFIYTGRVKALADAARAGGLEF